MNIPTNQRFTSGFTLIELAIVLIVVGLLAGSIIAGQHLLRNAELQKFIEKTSEIEMGITRFKEKYSFMPGDMPDATSVWGAAADCYGNSALTTKATCNGDGSSNKNMNGGGVSIETFLMWHHLRNDGMSFEMTEYNLRNIESINGTPAFIAGRNVPLMPFTATRVGVVMTYLECDPPYSFPWNCMFPVGAPRSWALQFGEEKGWGGRIWNQKTVTRDWYFAIVSMDQKIDDGLPLAGKITTRNNINWSGANPDFGDRNSRYRTDATLDMNNYATMTYRMVDLN